MKLASCFGLLGLLLCWALPAGARPPMGADSPMSPRSLMGPRSLMQRPEFLRHVFTPELIMRYQSDIDLTPSQRESITQTMGQTQKKLVDLRWQFEAESQALAKLLEGDAIDEAAALAQAQKVTSIEQQIKQEHLGMLIRIKNQLTPEQQAKLRQVRPERRRRQFRR